MKLRAISADDPQKTTGCMRSLSRDERALGAVPFDSSIALSSGKSRAFFSSQSVYCFSHTSIINDGGNLRSLESASKALLFSNCFSRQKKKDTMSQTFPTCRSTNDAHKYLHLFLVRPNGGQRAGQAISPSPSSNKEENVDRKLLQFVSPIAGLWVNSCRSRQVVLPNEKVQPFG